MNLARAALCRRHSRITGAPALIALLGLSTAAQAEPARRVVLVVPGAIGPIATEALTRVRGELQAARFEVITDVVAADVDRRATVEREVRKGNARAAFGIFFGTGVAEIWVTDAVSGRTAVQMLPLDAAAPERRAAVLAVKAVDLLKATLAEIWIGSPVLPPPAGAARESARSSTSPLPVPAAAAPAPPRRSEPAARTPEVDTEPQAGREPDDSLASLGRRVDISAGIGWIGAGGINTWAPLLAVSAFSGHIGVRLVATGFGSSGELNQPAGSARMAYGLALGELAARQPFGHHFETTASLSAGAARLSVDGSGATGYQGSSARVWSAVGGGGIGAAVLVSRLTISIDARVLVSATATEVRIDGEDVLRAGRPLIWIGGSAGVQL
jgi:hypothetical protein